MSAVSIQSAPESGRTHPAAVRERLALIRSRSALIEAYRNELRGRLAGSPSSSGSPAEVLDLAYAMRWWELTNESTAARRASRT